jgi:hypothetical protein
MYKLNILMFPLKKWIFHKFVHKFDLKNKHKNIWTCIILHYLLRLNDEVKQIFENLHDGLNVAIHIYILNMLIIVVDSS